MRALNTSEASLVQGRGAGLQAQVADACKGQPDSANVTVTTTSSGNIGGTFGKVLGSADASEMIKITVNCGEFREEQSKKSGP